MVCPAGQQEDLPTAVDGPEAAGRTPSQDDRTWPILLKNSVWISIGIGVRSRWGSRWSAAPELRGSSDLVHRG